MVKGITRRVVFVKSPDPRIFDEAIFIVKDDAVKKPGVTNEEILREAQSAAENYVRSKKEGRRGFPLPHWGCALLGAGGMGLVWFLTSIL